MKKRKSKGVSRRDFLGVAAFGTVLASFSGMVAWAARLFKPDVYYEETKRVRVGKPGQFPVGTWKMFEEQRLFVFSDDEGLYAITAVCQHLGCTVYKTDWGFQCPCHGSKYDRDGNVIAGPAPRGLPWYRMDQLVDGTLVVDMSKEVTKGTKYLYT